MTGIEILQYTKNCRDQMKTAEETYYESFSKACKITASYSDSNSGYTNIRKNEILFLSCTEAEEYYAECICLYVDACRECLRILDESCLEWNEYHVLHERFIMGKEWKTIAEEMGQTMRNCMILCDKACNKIKRLEGD